MDTAEEALMGLHRNTWHMMIRTDASRPDLPEWEGQQLKRARGRFLTQTKIHLGLNVSLAAGQVFCSHVGCRKSFTCDGV